MDVRKSVGLWIRVSTEDQAKGESPEHHEQRGSMYADLKEWDVITVYHLEGVSGKTVKHHPETQRMLADVASGKITGLIFSKLARFARNTRELLEFADIFKQHNADLISLQELIDTSTPSGRFFFTLTAAMTQWEREEIADRVAASVPIRAKLGKPLGGAAPYGYKWVDKKLELDSNEALVRKLIFELFLEHKKKKKVARILTERGYRTRKGSEFSNTTIQRLLRDTIAKGKRKTNYTKSLGENKKWELKPKSDWVIQSTPAIVSEELWEKVNSILDEQQRTNARGTKRLAHLFTRLAECYCGTKMYVPSNTPKYVCQKCKNKLGEEELEKTFLERFKAFLSNEVDIQKALDQIGLGLQDKQRRLDLLLSESKRLDTRLNSILNLHLEGTLSKEAFSKHHIPLYEQFQQIQKQIPLLQAEITSATIDLNSSEHKLQNARSIYAQWEYLTFEEKRVAIEYYVVKVVIGAKEVKFTIYLDTNSEIGGVTEREHNPKDSSQQLT